MPNQSSAYNGPPPFGNMNLGPKPSEHQAPTQLPAQGMQMSNFNAANSPNFAQRQFQRNQTPPSMLNMSNANARFPPQQCGPNNNMIPQFYRPAMQQNVSWTLYFGLRILLRARLLFRGSSKWGFHKTCINRNRNSNSNRSPTCRRRNGISPNRRSKRTATEAFS